MNTQNPKLRKAAILIASLDETTADALLQQMEPEYASRVRQAVDQLDDIGAAEQASVVAEFRRRATAPPASTLASDDGVAFVGRFQELPETMPNTDNSASHFSHRLSSAPQNSPNAAPFGILHSADSELVISYLQREHPQTIAVVVSHLSPDRAADLLERFSPDLQADVVRRLVDLEQTDPEVLREIERGLESWLSNHLRADRRRAAGLAAAQRILKATGAATQQQILTNLARSDGQLADRLNGGPIAAPAPPLPDKSRTSAGRMSSLQPAAAPSDRPRIEPPRSPLKVPTPWNFDTVERLDDAALASLFQTVDANLTVLALAGAKPALIERIGKRLSSREAKQLRKSLSQLGPTRLHDVEQAQQEMADAAQILAESGKIRPPRGALTAA